MRISEITESGLSIKKSTTRGLYYARIAQQNVDNHIGDLGDEPDYLYDNVIALAYDAVIDAGGTSSDARAAAEQIGMEYR